jgi:LytS/YehU family sensor histidine kinase
MSNQTHIILPAILAFLFFLFALIIAYLLFRLSKSEKKQNELLDKVKSLESKVHHTELRQIEAKLNPHLFKNVLNSIQSHAYQTYYALDKLANVLDYILYESRKKYVSPREEIEFAVNFIEINKIKLSPLFDLKVKKKINSDEPLYEQNLLVPLISVDLIENAFKHADLQSADAFISVTFEFRENIFSLIVANKISERMSLKKDKSGIGTETFEQRLKIIYRENYTLEKFTENDVFIAHLKINLLEHKTKMPDIR